MEISPTTAAPDADLAAKPPVPWWQAHRLLYDWVLSLAESKHSNWALFALSFSESSFFPIPPDVLQIALTLGKRQKAWWYALVSTVASVLGALFGYLIGYAAWEVIRDPFFHYVPGVDEEVFGKVVGLYEQWNFWIVFVAAFTPIPYKVITVAGGVCHIALLPFVVASIIGRGARFFLVAAMLYLFGPPIKTFIDKYFNLLSLLFAALLIGGFLLLKVLH